MLDDLRHTLRLGRPSCKTGAQTTVVRDVAAFATNVVNDTTGAPQRSAGRVSADYFRLLGAPVLLGRTFSADEDQPNGPRPIASLRFGVQARDPLVFVGVPLLLAAVSRAAVWLPARCASGVDPLAALRYE